MPEQDVLVSIRADLQARIEQLRPLVEEVERLERAVAALEAIDSTPVDSTPAPRRQRPLVVADATSATTRPAPDPAPYGYLADGKTPRKRRAPANPDFAKQGWETKRRRAREAAAAQTGESDDAAGEEVAASPTPQVLRVLSSTHPTRSELRDRRVVWTTEAPAKVPA